MSCSSFTQGGQRFCPKCRLVWDLNDPEPPVCGETLLNRAEIKERLEGLSERMEAKPCGTCGIRGPEWCESGQERGTPCNVINKGLS